MVAFKNPDRLVGAAVAIAWHALLGIALMTYEPARSALLGAAPVMVDFILPPRVETKPEPLPEIIPPKPKPVAKPLPKPPEPRPMLTAPVEAPSPVAVPPPPPPPPPPQPEPAPVVAAPAPAAAPVVHITPPVFNAAYLDNPAPSYPRASRRAGEQGRVVLRVLVSVGGTAEEIHVRDSSGYVRLDEAARETVRRWRFVPAKRGDQTVAAWVLVPIIYRLEG